MSDAAKSDPKPSSSNPSSSGTNTEKKASRKDYYARRDASRVYLFENFVPWREFKKKHGLKTDADVAEMLLENFDATKSSRALCNVETQTEEANVETMELYLSGISSVKSTTRESQVPPSLPSPIVTSTPGPWTRSARRRLLSESSPVTAKSSSSRSLDPLEEETLTANESDEDMEITMTAKTISPSNERSQLENLSLEDEIFNTTFTGHGGDEPEDKVEAGGDGVASNKYVSTVWEVTPQEAIRLEK